MLGLWVFVSCAIISSALPQAANTFDPSPKPINAVCPTSPPGALTITTSFTVNQIKVVIPSILPLISQLISPPIDARLLQRSRLHSLRRLV